uniref:Putative mating pair formation protein n=1 Tax=Stenotrophomonas maltophilia TaxID=40324 RepID=Q7WZL3_STEMA|nr:putative mating pair formation protein [Stenotrophomonas maltophilia]
MSQVQDDIGGPDDSPDFQIHPKPTPPKGLKRINKIPLVIVGVIVVAIVFAITYTMSERQAAEMQQKSTPKTPVSLNEAAAAPTTAGSAMSGDGYIAPDMPADPVMPAGGPPPPQDIPDGAPSDGSGGGPGLIDASPEPSPEEQFAAQWRMARLEKLKELEESKFEAQRAALQGDSTSGGKGEQNAAAAGLDPATMAALSGLAGVNTGGMDPATAAQIAELQKLSSAALGGAAGQDAGRQAQADKRAFLEQGGSSETYLKATREVALSPYELKAGSLIPSMLISGINSDLPGQIIGQVRENVYDTATGRHLLIPQGSRLVGTYDIGISFGQNRVLAGWTRVIYPDGSSLNIGLMPGSDRAGYAGFGDKTNNHYLSTFGSAFLIAAFTSGVQLSQPRSSGTNGAYDSQQILAGELGRQLGQVGAEHAKRSLDRAATVEVRPGYKFNVMVSKDIILPPYSRQR